MAANYTSLASQRTVSPLMAMVAVTPSDSVDLPNGVTRAVYVGVTGTLIVIDQYGNTTTLNSIQAGVFHPIQAKRIGASSSATGIVAGY